MTDVLSEKAFGAQIEQAAKLFSWKFYHTFRSQWSPAGFPDYVFVKGNRIIFAEIKAEKGKLSEPQREWLWALASAGAEVYVWKPPVDAAVQVLGRLR